MSKEKWYIAGLHFECQQCGNCCCGPETGYVWLAKKEAELMADRLKITPNQLRQKYCRRVGLRTSLIEQRQTKDCVFLESRNGHKCCAVYGTRPSQCRNWPFWNSNLNSPNNWNEAALHCPGINRGRLYSFDEIERLKKRKKWWQNEKP